MRKEGRGGGREKERRLSEALERVWSEVGATSSPSGDSWLTNGCERDAEVSTSTVTVCQCYHLTSFALLMSPTSSSPSNNRPLHIATKVGLSLSITCLFITILLLYTLK